MDLCIHRICWEAWLIWQAWAAWPGDWLAWSLWRGTIGYQLGDEQVVIRRSHQFADGARQGPFRYRTVLPHGVPEDTCNAAMCHILAY